MAVGVEEVRGPFRRARRAAPPDDFAGGRRDAGQQLTAAFVSAYQKHPRIVVALALNASLRFALSVVALTRHIITWVGADDWRGATKAAGDEALWLMAIALARDLRKGEDGLDESLRDAFLGAMVAGAVALVAKLCRARAARLALDEPLEPSYVAATAASALTSAAALRPAPRGLRRRRFCILLPDHRN